MVQLNPVYMNGGQNAAAHSLSNSSGGGGHNSYNHYHAGR